MANQGNDPNRGNQKAGQQGGKQNEQDLKSKEEERRNADVSGANDTGNKSHGGKFDSGNQTNR